MGLVLVDLDRVLAMNADGGDCRRGQAVFRASPTLKRGSLGPQAEARFVVLTHRNRTGARELLGAVGLPDAELVAADDLLSLSLRRSLRERSFPGLAKSVALPVLQSKHGWEHPSTTALIDDGRFNCLSMVEAGVVEWCIQVPSAEIDRHGGVEVFDFATALRWAVALVAPGSPSAARPTEPGVETPLAYQGSSMVGHRGMIWTAPCVKSRMEELATGQVLRDRSLDTVSLLRAARRVASAFPRLLGKRR